MASNLLTVKQVEHTKPSTKDVYLNDGGGLELKITPTNYRIWRLRYTLKGKGTRKSVLFGFGMGLAEARERANAIRKEASKGICLIEREAAEAAAIARQEEEIRLSKLKAEETERLARESIRTVEQVIEDWLTLEIQNSRKDKGAETRRMLAKDVLPYIGGRELKSVAKTDVLTTLDRVKMRGSSVQANHVFSDLRQFFNWCLRRDLIDRSPVATLSKEKDAGGKVTERERVLTREELRLLRDKLPDAKMERTSELAIWIQLSTIVRIGELLQARWEHIDFKQGTWTIPAGNSKNAKEHTVYLSAFAQRHFEELRSLTGWSAWVYPSTRTTDTHVDLKSMTRQVNDRQRDEAMQGRSKATSTLLLPGGKWTPHDLRRTGATLMGELGVLSEVIERCLNHAEANKLKRIYQRHELKAERQEAWERLGELLNKLVFDDRPQANPDHSSVFDNVVRVFSKR